MKAGLTAFFSSLDQSLINAFVTSKVTFEAVVEMGKFKCLYAFDQPEVHGSKVFWVVNFKMSKLPLLNS